MNNNQYGYSYDNGYNYENGNNYNNYPKKNSNKGLIITLIILSIVLVALIIISFVVLVGNDDSEDSGNNNEIVEKEPEKENKQKIESKYYGSWVCNNSLMLTLDSSNFNLDSSGSKLHIKAKYTIENFSEIDYFKKYELNVTATERIVNGEKLTGNYSTGFELVVDDRYDDTLAMANTKTGSIYQCSRGTLEIDDEK